MQHDELEPGQQFISLYNQMDHWLREFTGSEDPLDPATDTGDPIATDTVTGRRVKARAGTDFCEIASSLAYGTPYQRIIEAAAAERSDLIVMGVRGRNALDVTLFGSTANQVVRRASCPVLTLRQ